MSRIRMGAWCHMYLETPFHVLLRELRQLVLIQPEEKVPAGLACLPGKQEHSLSKVPWVQTSVCLEFYLCFSGHYRGCWKGSLPIETSAFHEGRQHLCVIFITPPQNREATKCCASLCFASWGWSPQFPSWASCAKQSPAHIYSESNKLTCDWATSRVGAGNLPAVCALADWAQGITPELSNPATYNWLPRRELASYHHLLCR